MFHRTGGLARLTPAFRLLAIGAVVSGLMLAPSAAPPAAAQQQVVRIGTLPGLRYDTQSFSVRPGVEVQLIFSNYDEMLHNLVITRPGTREQVVQAALVLGPGAADRAFIPESDDVLWHTPLVDSDESFTLTFTAPTAVGDYPFVCTVPGHGLVMFGTMAVTDTPGPPVMTPVDPPPDMDHGGKRATPRVMRGFMPDSGPASISVELPGGVSYVWDAGAGRFRYAWTGANPTMPSSPERGLAQLDGDVFYRESAYPLRFGTTPNQPPTLVQFRGYAIDPDGIPEFETLVDGVTVRERAAVVDGRLVRRFRITGAETVWFAVPADGLATAATGTEGAFSRFVGSSAAEFTVAFPIPAASAGAAVVP